MARALVCTLESPGPIRGARHTVEFDGDGRVARVMDDDGQVVVDALPEDEVARFATIPGFKIVDVKPQLAQPSAQSPPNGGGRKKGK